MPKIDPERFREAFGEGIYRAALAAGACAQTAEALADHLAAVSENFLPYVWTQAEAGNGIPAEPDRHGWEER